MLAEVARIARTPEKERPVSPGEAAAIMGTYTISGANVTLVVELEKRRFDA
jgi:hypothetical protein